MSNNLTPKLTIVIIDDDRELLSSMKKFLRAYGRTVEAYASGTAFLDVGWQDQVGCLVVDAVMPGIDGVALLERLKRGMTHTRGTPHHPQSQGKIERWHQTPEEPHPA